MQIPERSLTLNANAEERGEGIEFGQEAHWLKLSRVKPEETVSVLFATEHSIAFGHFGLDGEINLEFMPWGQMECEDDELEFTHWMYLPGAPCWLRSFHGEIRTSSASADEKYKLALLGFHGGIGNWPSEQLRLWN